MAKTTESVFGLAVLRVLASRPGGEANVRTLIRYVPDYVNLTGEDHELSGKRPGEEMWEQRVRNLKSHSPTSKNVIAVGLVEHVGHDRYRITDAGWAHLKSKGPP